MTLLLALILLEMGNYGVGAHIFVVLVWLLHVLYHAT